MGSHCPTLAPDTLSVSGTCSRSCQVQSHPAKAAVCPHTSGYESGGPQAPLTSGPLAVGRSGGAHPACHLHSSRGQRLSPLARSWGLVQFCFVTSCVPSGSPLTPDFSSVKGG